MSPPHHAETTSEQPLCFSAQRTGHGGTHTPAQLCTPCTPPPASPVWPPRRMPRCPAAPAMIMQMLLVVQAAVQGMWAHIPHASAYVPHLLPPACPAHVWHSCANAALPCSAHQHAEATMSCPQVLIVKGDHWGVGCQGHTLRGNVTVSRAGPLGALRLRQPVSPVNPVPSRASRGLPAARSA